ncbi:MAG: hypothetical protein ABI650_04110 [Dokdonella sp.]
MTGRRSERDLERLLEPERGEFGAIYDRLSRAEPPRRLDRAVIAQATRAARGSRAPSSQRWMLGIGSVAGVVLAAGIAWQVGRELESRDAVPASAPPVRSAPHVVPVQPISPPATTIEESTAEMGASSDSEAKQIVVTGSRERAEQSAKPTRAASRTAARPPRSPASPPARTEAEAFPQAPAEPLPMQDQRAPGQDLDSELSRKSRAEPATDAAEERGARSGAAGNRAAEAPVESAPRSISAPAPTTSIRLRRNMQLDAQAWLAEIAQLRRQGRTQEAIENVRMFQRMHPDWPVSDELRRLAQ